MAPPRIPVRTDKAITVFFIEDLLCCKHSGVEHRSDSPTSPTLCRRNSGFQNILDPSRRPYGPPQDEDRRRQCKA
ncbi:hypothetical protein D8666_08745 [Ochrobactrum soli]|nr:hypothetical protein D8666_08745 [[Ochrobactrum] soli]